MMLEQLENLRTELIKNYNQETDLVKKQLILLEYGKVEADLEKFHKENKDTKCFT